jgi:hypothetical protein
MTCLPYTNLCCSLSCLWMGLYYSSLCYVCTVHICYEAACAAWTSFSIEPMLPLDVYEHSKAACAVSERVYPTAA